MLANFHTHTTYCDGKSTPEEVVQAAIELGFTALGFSGHGYTPFDLHYCMKDTEGYLAEIARLREKYRDRICILAGVEEDAFAPVERSRFDYVIGSSHYIMIDGRYLPIDSGHDLFMDCLRACGGDVLTLAENYYGSFCRYLKARKPDIIGHFDLITKYDEVGEPIFRDHVAYHRLSRAYAAQAAETGCVFEVNTGAISRGYRTVAYPSDEILYLLKQENARLILSADSHHAQTLTTAFAQTADRLYEIGYRQIWTLTEEGFVPVPLR